MPTAYHDMNSDPLAAPLGRALTDFARDGRIRLVHSAPEPPEALDLELVMDRVVERWGVERVISYVRGLAAMNGRDLA